MTTTTLPTTEARTREEHEANLRRLTAEAATAGDAFAAKLRALVGGYLADEADFPGPAAFPHGPGPRTCGYALPTTVVNHFLGGPDCPGLWEQTKSEQRKRGWLVDG